MKKIISVILAVCLLVTLVSCHPNKETLEAPTNVKVSRNGLITWNEVPNATGYIVTVNETTYNVTETRYQVQDTSKSFTCSVVAMAEGYNNSEPSEPRKFTPYVPPVDPTDDITVSVSGASDIHSGKSATMRATVKGSDNQQVAWSIVEGGQYASVDANGVVQADEVDGDKLIRVRATSAENSDAYGEKVITVNAETPLTQQMLDEFCSSAKVSFEGYINVNIYYETITGVDRLVDSRVLSTRTTMDGQHWYAAYNTGIAEQGLFYSNVDGDTYQVGLSFTNEESYTAVRDERDNVISWQDSGFYNSFYINKLSVSDFEFDNNSWRHVYRGNDNDFVDKVIAAATPYEFIAERDEQRNKHFSLIIDDGEIIGIYVKSEADYTLVEGRKSVMEMFVAVNYNDTVTIPTITKYSHDDDLYHDELQAAIDKMNALTSYTLDFKQILGSASATSVVESGYLETVTSTDCLFQPYSVRYENGSEFHDVTSDDLFGYQLKNADAANPLYNSYYTDRDGSYKANRAFAEAFATARPSFAFAAEIFRSVTVDEDAGTKTFYVENTMSQVASTFYKHTSNDIDMYAIYATEGRLLSDRTAYAPYVTVDEDGYIVKAGFFFYMGPLLYGEIEIEYGSFDTAELPQDADVQFTTRQMPLSWNDVVITVDESEKIAGLEYVQDETDEKYYFVNALEYMKKYFNRESIADDLPFFGVPLKDTFGFGSYGAYSNRVALAFYFDVPIDSNYTIDTSVNAVTKYLLNAGFERTNNGQYRKNGICVAPTSHELDLIIYVWAENVTQ